MDDQTNPELPVEMVEPEDEKLINPSQSPPPKMPAIIPIAGMLVVVVIIAVIFIIVSGMAKKSKEKTAPQVTPTAQQNAQTSSQSLSPTQIPVASSSPVLINLPPNSLPLILEVTAVGGGATGEKREYTINLKMEKNDKLSVIQVHEAEITGYPGYVKGAIDKGLRIVHESAYLDIVPVFEGTGFPLKEKANAKTVKNKELTDKTIYRLDLGELPDDIGLPDTKGFIYTTQYVENQGSCTSTFGGSFPACINGGLQVDLKDSGPVTLTCIGNEVGAAWCDSIVKSLSITGNENP